MAISDFSFRRETLRVRPGTTVRRIDEDPVAHTSTSDEGVWDSDLIGPGESCSRTFREPGRYPYHCTPHPFMEAVVVVIDEPDGGWTMRKLSYSILTLAVALLFVPACGGNGGGTGPYDGDDNDNNGNGGNGTGGSVGATVTIDDIAYIDPNGGRNTNATVTIQVGEAVRWVNEDDVDHTVDSGEGQGGSDGDGLPDGVTTGLNGTLAPGGDYEFTFDTPGTWTYYCEIHPGTMYEATVIVEE